MLHGGVVPTIANPKIPTKHLGDARGDIRAIGLLMHLATILDSRVAAWSGIGEVCSGPRKRTGDCAQCCWRDTTIPLALFRCAHEGVHAFHRATCSHGYPWLKSNEACPLRVRKVACVQQTRTRSKSTREEQTYTLRRARMKKERQS